MTADLEFGAAGDPTAAPRPGTPVRSPAMRAYCATLARFTSSVQSTEQLLRNDDAGTREDAEQRELTAATRLRGIDRAGAAADDGLAHCAAVRSDYGLPLGSPADAFAEYDERIGGVGRARPGAVGHAHDGGAVGQAPDHGSVSHAPDGDTLDPTHDGGTFRQEPDRGAVDPRHDRDSVNHARDDGAVNYAGDGAAVDPTHDRGAVDPTHDGDPFRQVPDHGTVGHAPGRGAVDPTYEGGPVDPTYDGGTVGHAPGSGAVDPTYDGDTVDPARRPDSGPSHGTDGSRPGTATAVRTGTGTGQLRRSAGRLDAAPGLDRLRRTGGADLGVALTALGRRRDELKLAEAEFVQWLEARDERSRRVTLGAVVAAGLAGAAVMAVAGVRTSAATALALLIVCTLAVVAVGLGVAAARRLPRVCRGAGLARRPDGWALARYGARIGGVTLLALTAANIAAGAL